MSNILLMNAGSSSVKWKLFELETEKVVAKGLVERLLTLRNMPFLTARFSRTCRR